MARTQRTGKKLYQQQPALSLKGGLPRNIDQATGDIARTTSGWIEDEKFGVYLVRDEGTVTAKFTDDFLLGRKVANMVCGTAARSRFILGMNNGTGASQTVSNLYKYAIPVLPSTTYRFSTPFLFSGFPASDSNIVLINEHDVSGTRVTSNDITSNSVTSVEDYTEFSKTFTTSPTTAFLVISLGPTTASNNINFSADIIGTKLDMVSTINNSSSVPALFYPKATAVTSTDNIDQSQVVQAGTNRAFGDNVTRKYYAQQFTPTKKNWCGFVFQKTAGSGTYAGNVVAKLIADNSNNPTGSVLGTVTIPNATFNGYADSTDIPIVFDNTQLTIDGSTKYWWTLESSSVDAANFPRIVYNSGGGYSGGVAKQSSDGITWLQTDLSAGVADFYFKTLYSKNTTNFTVSTDTETLSVTAPTADGWEDGEVIDTFALGETPLTLAVGSNNIYYSSNGADEADGEVDPSLQVSIVPQLYIPYDRPLATSRALATNRRVVRDMGTALRFGATGANVITDNPVLTNFAATSYTISAWVRAQLVTSNTAANAQHVFASSGTVVPYIALSLRNGNYLLRYQDAGEDRQLTVKQIPNTFVLLTSVFDKTASNIKLYIDGTLSGTLSVTSYEDVLSGTLARIGFQTGTTSLDGIIDESRIWSRALTAQEVSDLYFNNIVPKDSLVAEYLFNEGTGTTAYDTSGNGNNGTISGATYTLDVPIVPRDFI